MKWGFAMKENYKVLEDGNVEVINFDNIGNFSIQKYEYNDNINEIFSIENIIEYLEKKAMEYKEQIRFDKEILNSGLNEFLFAIFCASSVIGGVACSASLSLGISIALIGTIICIPTYIYNSFNEYKKEKQIIAKEQLLTETEEIIDKYNKKLIKLKEEKNKVYYETDKGKSFKIIYLEQLKSIKEKFALYYYIIYNYKKMIRYYEKGQLNIILKENYSQQDINIITNYLEEKGPELVKRFNKNN